MRVLVFAMTAASAVATAASTAPAAVLVSESFDYAAGPIAGQNGGTGFTGAYNGAGNVTSPGLTYPNFAASGNKFTTAVPPDNAGGFRPINPINTDAGTVFVGFLASVPGAIPNYGGISFFTAGTPGQTGGSEELFLGKPSGTDSYGFDVSGVAGDDTVGTGRTTVNASAAPSLLVYRLNFTGAGDTIDVFVNPAPGEPLPATPNGTFAIPEDAFPDTFNNIRLQSGNQPISFDEYRIGTTYADVTPVPEPASAGLLAAAALGLLARRRPVRN